MNYQLGEAGGGERKRKKSVIMGLFLDGNVFGD